MLLRAGVLRRSWPLLFVSTLACTEWEVSAGDDANAGAGGEGGDAADPCAPENDEYPRGLHVDGNQLADSAGNVLVLRGVNHSGSEYKCAKGEGFFEGALDRCAIQAMKSWNIDALRIPLNEACWLALDTVAPSLAGENYKTAIQSYVARLHEYAIVPILDLHWAAPGDSAAIDLKPMPNVDHSIDFWADVARTFRDDDGVLFELYNEPFPDRNRDTDTAWECWRDGCEELEDPYAMTGPYEAAGMQALVDAIRATGSEHVLLLGGVEYSNALTQWLAYKPHDPLNQLAAAWHVYNFNRCANAGCWNGVPAEVGAEVPVIATEIGQNDCAGDFISPLMHFLDGRGMGYLAWSWNALGSCQPEVRTGPNRMEGRPWSLITSYASPQPNSDYARTFRDHLVALE